MFEASVDGQAYDPDRWSQYYKPSGFQGKGGDDTESTPAPAPQATKAAPVAEDPPFEPDEEPATASAPVVTPAAKPSSQRAEDILAMIRNRAK
jgi:hypothetical protein